MQIRNATEIGRLIREGRRRNRWSQSRLADEVGGSRQWISLVENGKTSVEFDLVLDVLHALGYVVSVSTTEAGEAESASPDLFERTHSTASRTPLTMDGQPLRGPGRRRNLTSPGGARDD